MEFLAQTFGTVTPPEGLEVLASDTGMAGLVSSLLKALMVGAGIYAVFNFVLAGYAYMSASGDPKGVQMATAKIWQSVVGVAVAVGALAIGGVASQLIYGNTTTLLNIQIYPIQ